MTDKATMIQQLRRDGNFCFLFKLPTEPIGEDRLRALLKTNFEKALDSFFQDGPSLANTSNELERL